MYSTVDDLFINLIKPLVHLYQTSTCSNSNCSNKEVLTQIHMLNKKTNDKMDKLLCRELHRCHEQCKQRLGNQRCSGT
uniref:Uncharacterized protein n=1 Tax=Romanomermis culicivorax TaxID=13658 RepID=A0A915J589_ROMCU